MLGVLAATAVLLLAGCGDDSGGDQGSATTPGTPSATDPTVEPSDQPEPSDEPEPTEEPVEPEPTGEPEPTDPFDPTPEPTKPSRVGELVGIPEPGVESGCWLLDGYLLLGGDKELLSSGQRLRVTGYVERDVATTCQQGIPYRVETVDPLE